jgi:hypothetical protein
LRDAAKFSIVLDITFFAEENEIEPYWINQMISLLPPHIVDGLSFLIIYNPNSSFKKFCKRIQRLFTNQLGRKMVFLGSLNEFNDFISPLELRLPKSTGI